MFTTKATLPISVRFSVRPSYTTLQVRITVAGKEGSPFSTLASGKTLSTAGFNWNQREQRVTGRSELDRLFNREISAIRDSLETIYEAQVQAGLSVTPKSIQAEYQTGLAPRADKPEASPAVYGAVGCYRIYLAELKAGGFPEKQYEKATLDKWQYGLTYLEAFTAAVADPLNDQPADQLTLFWGKTYHRWLMKNGPMAADSATRYVKRLSEAIDYVAESGKLKSNPLATLKLSRDKTKDVHFLDPHHLERFWALDLPGRTGLCCWWMGVIFLTGLDYPDAVRYVENRYQYERETQWGRQIVINRSKPPRADCYIPMLPELEALLLRRPEGPPPPDWEINREMRAVATLVGFPHRLTCKVGRKTAGSIFFAEYEDINAVSRMMGHSSVAITERYYVKTTGYTVARAMQKRFVNPTTYQPFRRVA